MAHYCVLNWVQNLFGALDQGVQGLGGDAALVGAVPGHLDVALIAPGGAPGVLHEPVAGTVANHEDGVVGYVVAARGLVVDS